MKRVKKIEKLLKTLIGLDVRTIGSSAIQSAIQHRMYLLHDEDLAHYTEFVLHDVSEQTALIERVVIPETWFFRDQAPFDEFRHQLHTRQRGDALKILSVPCATGEEPYSIALCLLEDGWAPNSFSIDAVDISAQALTKAGTGRYTKHSFRGNQSAPLIKKYFQHDGSDFILSPLVRQCVNFSVANILDHSWPFAGRRYDYVFCRNLLIYFDDEDKQKAHWQIHQLLANNGTLIVGYAEAASMPETLFVRTSNTSTFMFTKSAPPECVCESSAAKASRSHPRKALVKVVAKAPPPKPTVAAVGTKKPIGPSSENSETLECAQDLADRGDYACAVKICRQLLITQQIQDEVHVLLGLIEESQNNLEVSETHFRKAIYLNPKNPKALLHLALLLEHRGDQKTARLFFERATRAASQAEESKQS